jgi:hypothetical protein
MGIIRGFVHSPDHEIVWRGARWEDYVCKCSHCGNVFSMGDKRAVRFHEKHCTVITFSQRARGLWRKLWKVNNEKKSKGVKE